MTILITASGNFDNKKSWGGLRKHLEHDPTIDHKNEYLNTPESKRLRNFNQHLVIADFDEWTDKELKSIVEEHDKKENSPSRKYKTVKRFLTVNSRGQKRKTNLDLNYVAKFSDEQTWKAYKKAIIAALMKRNMTPEQAEKLAMKAVSDGLINWSKGFNKRNPNLKLFETYVHMDEQGAPHSHNRILPVGHTKRGKLSMSLNTALAEQYNMPRKGKELLSKFRKQEDAALVTSIDESVAKELKLASKLKLERKSDKNKNIVTGANHDEYVHNQHVLDNQQRQIVDKKKDFEKIQNDYTLWVDRGNKKLMNQLKQRTKQINQRTADLTARENKLDKYEKSLNKRENELDKREKDLNARELGGIDSAGNKHLGLVTRQSMLDERENELDEREDQVQRKEKEVKKQQGLIKQTVQAFADGFYQGITNDPSAEVKDLSNLADYIAISVQKPLAMIAGFRRGINKAVQVAKQNKILQRLSVAFKHVNLSDSKEQENTKQTKPDMDPNRDITDDMF